MDVLGDIPLLVACGSVGTHSHGQCLREGHEISTVPHTGNKNITYF